MRRGVDRLLAVLAVATWASSASANSPPAEPDTAWHWDMTTWMPEHQHASLELHYAPVWYRGIRSADPHWPAGFEVGFGARATTRALPFLLSWSSEPALRILDSKSFALSILQRVFAAVALGPFEPELGAGLSLITVDVFHANFSAELASPRAEVGFWMHFRSLRVGAHAYAEYLWRWLGDRDYLLRGVAIELAVESSSGAPRR
jgi:hypothetical protein